MLSLEELIVLAALLPLWVLFLLGDLASVAWSKLEGKR
jgi:hypothetical protein